jgi:hypothetical protein
MDILLFTRLQTYQDHQNMISLNLLEVIIFSGIFFVCFKKYSFFLLIQIYCVSFLSAQEKIALK